MFQFRTTIIYFLSLTLGRRTHAYRRYPDQVISISLLTDQPQPTLIDLLLSIYYFTAPKKKKKKLLT